MSKYLKSYKRYPAGTLIVAKKYSFLSRLKNLFKKGKSQYNYITILPKASCIGLTKYEKFKNDYHLFIPKQPYKHKEIKLLGQLIKSCQSNQDYLVAINKIREGSVDVNNLDDLRNNENYTKIYLEEEPFQDVHYVAKKG